VITDPMIRRPEAPEVALGDPRRSWRWRCAPGILLLLLAAPAGAQESAVRVPEFGGVYAQFVGIALSEDLSAARYRLDPGEGFAPPRLDVTRAPWRFASTAWAGARVDWELQAGYMKLTDEFTFDVAGLGTGHLNTNWSAGGLTLGALPRWPVSAHVGLGPVLRVGVAHLRNEAIYDDITRLLQPLVDGQLLNWSSQAWVASGGLGFESAAPWQGFTARSRGQVVRTWVASFRASAPAGEFRDGSNTLSLRGELERATPWSIAERRLSGLGVASYARMFGGNSGDLGFNAIHELGAGLSVPLSATSAQGLRVRLTGSMLWGKGISGRSIGLALGGVQRETSIRPGRG
jgi:hypothetical protein